MTAANRANHALGRRELARRSKETNRWIGRQILEARTEAGVSQAQLSHCAGLAPSYVWRIEAGLANPSVNALTAVAVCLGCDLGVRLFPTSGPRLHDRWQAPMVEALIRAAGLDWHATPEVPVPTARGVIDLVLRRGPDLIVVCECHSELRRLELAIRRLGEKADAMARLEPSANVSRLLAVRSTAATRAIARTYEATLAAAFPAPARLTLDALRGDGPWAGSGMLWLRVEGGRASVMERAPRGVRAVSRADTLPA